MRADSDRSRAQDNIQGETTGKSRLGARLQLFAAARLWPFYIWDAPRPAVLARYRAALRQWGGVLADLHGRYQRPGSRRRRFWALICRRPGQVANPLRLLCQGRPHPTWSRQARAPILRDDHTSVAYQYLYNA